MMSYVNFKNIYDQYFPMLYSLAWQICNSDKHTEKLLIRTFKKIREDDFSKEKYPAYGVAIVRLILKIGKELYPLKFKNGLILKQFKTTPLIYQIICNRISLEDYCRKKFLTKEEGLQILRKEFSAIRNGKKNKVAIKITNSRESEWG